jgi:hypothetical protein
MRWLSRLLIIFVICFVAIAPSATPTQAADGASITLSPSSGVPGTEVTVYGNNFTADEWVDIYYCLNTACLTAARTWVAEAETDDDGYFRVDFTVPESYKGAHEVRVYISTSLQTKKEFTVKPGLTVSPEEGLVGTNVTVEGRGFAEDEENIELRYYLDGSYETIAEDIRADEDGRWEKSILIPPSDKGNHKIDARGDESSLAQVKDATFEVTPGISLDKSSGSVGENITMTGSGFAGDERDISILFAGQEVETEIRADATGYWQESFDVPEMPTGTYSVTAEGEHTRQGDINALSFNITPGLVLSPAEGHVGTNVTVAGHGFAANKNAVIKYEGNQKATATTNDKGSFDISFVVPESQHGGRLVAAEDAAGNNATAIFTMESDPPPIPELISPTEGSRIGFTGRVRPTFQWSAVSDDSGVYYSLQIATSANVTASGKFVDPVVSVTEIVGTNYTLEKTLSYGTYYWIVQAIDGAANAGNWTAACSFRAGVLPLWAFILIIIAVVVTVGALVYFLVMRRRIYY